MGANNCCAAFAGFSQFVLGLSLIIIVLSNLRHAGPDSCVYSASEDVHVDLCSSLYGLGLLSVGSSLIISVSQGVTSLLLGMPARCTEVLLRAALSIGWLVAAIMTTVATVQADHADHQAQRTHWRHVGLGITWAMALVAGAMSLAALLGACCIDLPLYLLCCCPTTRPHHMRITAYDHEWSHRCEGLMTAIGITWLMQRLFSNKHECHHPYQPIPTAYPAPPSSMQPSPFHHEPSYPAGSHQPYAPPTVMQAPLPPFVHIHSPASTSMDQPVMAPVYSPFTQGPVPSSVGWGIPVAPPHRAPWLQPGPQPAPGHIYPPVPDPSTSRPAAAWYPQVTPAGPGIAPPEAGASGYAGAAAPSNPPPYKEGYEPPSAPPGPK